MQLKIPCLSKTVFTICLITQPSASSFQEGGKDEFHLLIISRSLERQARAGVMGKSALTHALDNLLRRPTGFHSGVLPTYGWRTLTLLAPDLLVTELVDHLPSKSKQNQLPTPSPSPSKGKPLSIPISTGHWEPRLSVKPQNSCNSSITKLPVPTCVWAFIVHWFPGKCHGFAGLQDQSQTQKRR